MRLGARGEAAFFEVYCGRLVRSEPTFFRAFSLHHGFLADFAIVLTIGALIGLVALRLRQPSILGYLLAGLVVGPYLPIPIYADAERVHTMSEFGVVLVMLTVGLELRLLRFVAVLPTVG